jgi:DNA processing protein
VSGMARGIDAAAHAGALDAGGTTIGVLGHGIDRAYPAENRALFRRLRERGLLLSELPPGEEPLAGNFPRRNRLIAALSEGVLVVEMGERSGARHTVDAALELGREVFAVPGAIGSPVSAGTNQLLKEGARLVTSALDVVEELRGVGAGPPRGAAAASPARATAPRPALPELPPAEASVLAALGSEPRHVDEVAAASGLPAARILPLLLALELGERIEALPGMRFRAR